MRKMSKWSAVGLIVILLVTVMAGCTAKTDTPVSEGKTPVSEVAPYADDSFMVDADWLSQNLGKEDVVILDARNDKDYKKGHIPGAVNVAWQAFANMNGKPGDKGWGVVLDHKALGDQFAAVGVAADKTVIVYADTLNGWGEDGRFVWMLKMAGIEKAKFLNGGIGYWEAKGYEVTKEEPTVQPGNLVVAGLDQDLIADTDWVKENLGTAKILDSRSKGEYAGAVKFGEARGGHLPGAILVPYEALLNADATLKSQEELEVLFSNAGLKKDDEIVTYCTAGIRSAHLTVALRMAGYEKARNYDESFYTWAADQSLELE